MPRSFFWVVLACAHGLDVPASAADAATTETASETAGPSPVSLMSPSVAAVPVLSIGLNPVSAANVAPPAVAAVGLPSSPVRDGAASAAVQVGVAPAALNASGNAVTQSVPRETVHFGPDAAAGPAASGVLFDGAREHAASTKTDEPGAQTSNEPTLAPNPLIDAAKLIDAAAHDDGAAHLTLRNALRGPLSRHVIAALIQTISGRSDAKSIDYATRMLEKIDLPAEEQASLVAQLGLRHSGDVSEVLSSQKTLTTAFWNALAEGLRSDDRSYGCAAFLDYLLFKNPHYQFPPEIQIGIYEREEFDMLARQETLPKSVWDAIDKDLHLPNWSGHANDLLNQRIRNGLPDMPAPVFASLLALSGSDEGQVSSLAKRTWRRLTNDRKLSSASLLSLLDWYDRNSQSGGLVVGLFANLEDLPEDVSERLASGLRSPGLAVDYIALLNARTSNGHHSLTAPIIAALERLLIESSDETPGTEKSFLILSRVGGESPVSAKTQALLLNRPDARTDSWVMARAVLSTQKKLSDEVWETIEKGLDSPKTQGRFASVLVHRAPHLHDLPDPILMRLCRFMAAGDSGQYQTAREILENVSYSQRLPDDGQKLLFDMRKTKSWGDAESILTKQSVLAADVWHEAVVDLSASGPRARASATFLDGFHAGLLGATTDDFARHQEELMQSLRAQPDSGVRQDLLRTLESRLTLRNLLDLVHPESAARAAALIPRIADMSGKGFFQSAFQGRESMDELLDALELERSEIGAHEYESFASKFRAIGDIHANIQIAPGRSLHRASPELGGYLLPYAVAGSGGDSVDVPAAFADYRPGSAANLAAQSAFDSFDALIDANYRALKMLSDGAEGLTPRSAELVMSELDVMVRRLGELVDASSEKEASRRLRGELETQWRDLPDSAPLPAELARRVSEHEGRVSSAANIQNVHTLVNYVHQRGIEALLLKTRGFGGNGLVTFSHGAGSISLLNLGKPLVRRGLPFNPLFHWLLRLKGDHNFQASAIFRNGEVWCHLALGAHSAEIYVKYAAPDAGGALAIRYKDSGIGKGSRTRLEYIRKSLEGLGLRATAADQFLEASWDKDSGLASRTDLGAALPRVITLLTNTKNYDYSFEEYDQSLRDELLSTMPSAFLAEGIIPVRDANIGNDMDRWQRAAPLRERLRELLDAELARLGLPAIPKERALGQATIDECFTRPIRLSLAEGALVQIGNEPPRRGAASPLDALASAVVARPEAALQLGDWARGIDPVELEFEPAGSIGRLRAERAQREMLDGGVLTVLALRDPETEAIAYAAGWRWDGRARTRLDGVGLATALAREGVQVGEPVAAGKSQQESWRRMLLASPEAAEENTARGWAASRGTGVAYGPATFDRSHAAKGSVLIVPFTTPDDLESMRRSAAVVTTGGGLLSHAAITARELRRPSVMLRGARWRNGRDGKRLVEIPVAGERPARPGPGGLMIRDREMRRDATIREGDIVAVDGAHGAVTYVGGPDAEPFAALLRELPGLGAVAPFQQLLKPLIEQAAPEVKSRMILLFVKEILSNPLPQADPRLQALRLATLADGLDRAQETDIRSWLDSEAETIRLAAEEPRTPPRGLASRAAQLQRLATAFALPASEKLAEAKALTTQLVEAEDKRAVARRSSVLSAVEALAARESSLDQGDLPELRRVLREAWPRRGRGAVRKILFVCAANTCRSPIAEHLAKGRWAGEGLNGVDFQSRGIGSSGPNEQITAEAAKALARRGLDASAHLSRALSARDAREADLILPMEGAQARFIESKFPEAAGKVFALKAYAGRGDGDVADPIGAGFVMGIPGAAGFAPGYYDRARRKVYDKTAGEIDAALDFVLAHERALRILDRKERELTAQKLRRLEAAKAAALPLGALDEDYVPITGGKAAKLGEILHVVQEQGGYVPEGIALTTDAYERFLKEAGIEQAVVAEARAIDAYLKTADLDSPRTQAWVRERAEKIQGLIRSKTMDASTGLGGEVKRALADHGMGEGPFAVRSSAVQEDGAEAAYAGAAETSLFVKPDEVLEKVVDGWASFWLPRGILYRRQHGEASADLKPAIVVQRMVESEASGVMFTVNPVTGRKETVINAAYGQGEGVVSGLVQADQYAADAEGEEVRVPLIGDKAASVERRGDGRGTEVKAVPSNRRRRRALTPEQVGSLARIGAALERHFGYPVDVEFAIEKGRIAILQVRPITAAP